MNSITIYADGVCFGNSDPGGYAAVIRNDGCERVIRGSEPVTTRHRMELTSAIAGLEALQEPSQVELISDSQYLVRGMTVWMNRWLTQGWWDAFEKPVENRDLWEKLLDLSERHNVRWTWIGGSHDHPEHETSDRTDPEAVDAMVDEVHLQKV
jgi:ribonuclease HI